MDRRGALAQRPGATARPNGEDLGDHGQRHLLRPVGADVEPDGPIHSPFLYLRLGGEGAEDALSALARPEHPDVRRRRLEERPYVRQIVREVVGHDDGVARGVERQHSGIDRKSTRLNSSHGYISYAVFCLKKKTSTPGTLRPFL